MPVYSYTARDSSGAAVSGTLSANSIGEVTQLLRAEGKYPTAITPATSAGNGFIPARGIKLSRSEVIQLSTQLAIMIDTGVPLTEALDSIAAQADKPNMRKLVSDVSQQIQGGSDLSSALSRHPRSFPRLYIALIRASEKSGMMGKLLIRATDYLRDEQEILRKVRGALTYPAILLSFCILIVILILTFVLPKLTVVYAAKAAMLPAPTRILMAMSDFMVNQWPWILAGLFTAGIGSYFYLRTVSGRRVFHYLQLHAPLLGKLFRKVHLARGMRMIGTMASSGIHLLDAVTTAHDLCGNSHFQDLWNDAAEQIQSGKQLSEPLFRSNLVPRSIAQMIHSAEKSGKLAQVLEQVAGYSENELKDKIAELTRYIEPIMIVVMGIIIGGVALALLLPIFTISRIMAQ